MSPPRSSRHRLNPAYPRGVTTDCASGVFATREAIAPTRKTDRDRGSGGRPELRIRADGLDAHQAAAGLTASNRDESCRASRSDQRPINTLEENIHDRYLH